MLQDPGANVVMSLADKFLSSKCYVPAVQCLEAVCLANELPLVEVETRLKLARVLIEHTGNIYEARQHLEKVLLLLTERSAYVQLKCEAFSELGRCQKYLGEIRLEKQTYEQALQYCTNREQLFLRYGKGVYLEWLSHFFMRMADALVAERNLEAAQSWLERGMSATQGRHYRLEALFLLSSTQLHLFSGNVEAAKSQLSACHQALLRLSSVEPVTPINQLKLHYTILKLLTAIVAGNTNELQPMTGNGGNKACPMLEALDAQCAAVRNTSWQYEWLPTAAVLGLSNLLAAHLLMPVGKFKQAFVYISRGVDVIDTELAEQQIHLLEGEEALSHHCIWELRSLLFFKMFFLEASATILLTQCNFQHSQRDILEMIRMSMAYPRFLAQLSGAVHALAGHYSILTGHDTAALEHYRHAGYLHGGTRGRLMSAVLCALTHMNSAGGDGNSLRRAADALRAENLYDSVPTTLPCAERAIALLVSGMLLVREGNEVEGKLRFTKALKVAHTSLGNHQVVMQVLNSMAPLQLIRGDVQGAKNMLSSSYTLAKNLNDLPSQMCCLRHLIHHAHTTGDQQEHRASTQGLERKSKEFAGCVELARANAQAHFNIVHWGVELGE